MVDELIARFKFLELAALCCKELQRQPQISIICEIWHLTVESILGLEKSTFPSLNRLLKRFLFIALLKLFVQKRGNFYHCIYDLDWIISWNLAKLFEEHSGPDDIELIKMFNKSFKDHLLELIILEAKLNHRFESVY